MDCREAQEQVLDSLAQASPATAMGDIETHLAECSDCRTFAETHLMLDRRLQRALPAPSLSPAFRLSLMRRIRRDPLVVWPEFLPDMAHLAGCVVAIVPCLLMLPWPAGSVILGGAVLAFATYLVQSAIRGSIEAWEEEWQ